MLKNKIYWAIAPVVLVSLISLVINKEKDKYKDPQPKVAYEIIETDYFEEAVQIIKDHEGWHSEKHYPYIGYGHKALKGDNLDHTISEEDATDLVRKDLLQKCAVFREFGKDSLLLGVLAYNIGEYRLINTDGTPKSNLVKKLKAGDRDIYNEYISFRMAWGRIIPSIEKRRITEFKQLFDKTHVTRRRLNQDH